MTNTKNPTIQALKELIKKGTAFDKRETAFVVAQEKASEKFKALIEKEKGSLNSEGKKLLAKFIKNKKIPLLERWNTFASAPDAFKNYSQYLPHMGPEFDSFVKAHVEDEGKGCVIDMTEWGGEFIFNYVEDGEDSCLEWDDTETLTNAALLEDILAHNLGSFCYDW